MSVPICNRFHTKRANNGKITLRGTPLWRFVRGEPRTQGHEILLRKTRDVEAAHGENFVILSLHRFDTAHVYECDRQTDGQTPRPWLRRAKHSAIARKNEW